MQSLWQDISYGVRMLVKNPVFTAVAVLTLALGIGANSAIFSVVNAVLLRPLPYPDPEQLVAIFGTNNNTGRYVVLPMQFSEWQARNHVFEAIAGYIEPSFNVTGGDQPARLQALAVTSGFFQVLAVRPQFGRAFLPEENYAGRNKVVVLSHPLWRRLFNADPLVIDKTLHLDGEIHTIIGVMPEDFQFTSQVDVITPISLETEIRPDGMVSMTALKVIARLKKGVTLQQAYAEMTSIARQMTTSAPESGVEVVAFHDLTVEHGRLALLLLLGAVAFVLLIACANVANLHLARGTTLQKEIAIRAALGASRARIIRQLLTQNMLLALLGGAGGLLLALWGIPLLMWLLPQSLPRLHEIDVDRTVFGFTLLTSLLTGLLFGLVPAVKVSRVEMTQALKEGSRAESKNFGRFGLQSFLVVAEFALALMLLVGAGLLLNSFVRLLRVDLGFNPENVLTFNVSLPITYPGKEQAASFYAQVLARVDALPGVAGAAIINTLPLGNGVMQGAFRVEGQPASDAPTLVTQPLVSSDYFQVMSIPLLKGRYFSERDTPESVGVVNINDTFARRFFSGEDPVGKHLSLYQDSKGKPIWLEIVGIVGDVRQDALSAQPEPALYVPYTQVSDPAMLSGMAFVVRTTVPSVAFSTAVQREIQAVNRDIPVTDMKGMREIVTESVADQRFITLLLGTFALLAIVLASVGIYGVVTYMVAQRTHEIGIRMALGARQRNVLRLVIGQGMMLAFVGVAIGNVFALWLTRMLSGMLYNVSPTDPLTFTCISILLVAVALVASYLPARRASQVDPIIALRYE